VTSICAICGHLGPVHRHHLTRRPAPGAPYYDDTLWLTACPRCHLGAGGLHQILRVVGLDWPGLGVDPMVFRLRTTAAHAELLADLDRPFTLAPVSARALAALLREGADAIGAAR
jgi:hypothetical protein